MPQIPEQALNALIETLSSLYDELQSRTIKESNDLWFLHTDRKLPEADDRLRRLMARAIDILVAVNPQMISRRLVLDKTLYGPISSGLRQSRAFKDVRDELVKAVARVALYESNRDVDVPLVNLGVGSSPRRVGLATFFAVSPSDRELGWWDRVRSYAGPNVETEVVSFARIESPGDLNRSVEFAGWVTDQTLTIIRAVGFPVLTSPQLQFGVLNDHPVWQSRPFRPHEPRENSKLEHASSMVELVGPSVAPYDLDKDILAAVDAETLTRLHQLIISDLRSPSTEMKAKFFTGLRWLGEATKPDSAAAKFIKLSFAIEALIGGDPGEPHLASRGITATLAERAAFLAGDTPARRLELHQAVTLHYAKRSNIVHGRVDEVSDDDLEHFSSIIRAIAWAVLAKIDRFTEVAALQRWILTRRYGDVSQC